MRFFAVAVVICSLFGAVGAACAQSTKPLSEDELKIQKLANATKARELYLEGEAAYKKGNLVSAVRAWAQALELKPDSTYTQQCLTKARNELYTRYIASLAKNSATQDSLTSLVILDSMIELLPGKTDLATRRADLFGKFTEDQHKAFDSYTEAMTCVDKQDYAAAKKAISNAEIYARGSKCIDNSVKLIDELLSGSADNVTVLPADAGKKLPIMYEFYATWCPPCKQMAPVIEEITREYAGKIEIKRFDIDKDKDTARKYGIRLVPTMIIFGTKGSQIRREEGAGTKEQFVEMFTKLGIR